MLSLFTQAPAPDGLPLPSLPLDYFLKLLDTPAVLWGVRIFLLVCAVGLLLVWRRAVRSAAKRRKNPPYKKRGEDA